jgi:hypothetical protein
MWDDLVAESAQGILYCREWWLDAVAPGRYELLTVRRGDRIQAGWPLVWAGETGRRQVITPPLTQKLGILFAKTNAKYSEELANQHELIEELIQQLPEDVELAQNFHENFTNWLPFFWHGYQQTSRYTYVLDDLSNTAAIWEQMRHKTRTEIRKAQRSGVRVVETDDLDRFYRVNTRTFERQQMKVPYTLNFVRRIDDACRRHAGRRILLAVDPNGRVLAGIYLVYDSACTILLLSGGDAELRNQGAGALLTWESICFAATVSRRFDFEGSMMQPVERNYRGFGAKQTPYFRIWGRPARAPKSPVRHFLARALRKAARIVDE